MTNTVSSSEIDLSWQQVPNGTASDGTPYTITGYRIERSDDGENFYDLATIDPSNLDASTTSFVGGNYVYRDTGLADGTREWYRVRAIATGTDSPDSAYSPKEWSVTDLPAPTGLMATLDGSTTVDLNWTNSTSAATGLTVYAEANTDPFSPDYSGSGDGGSPTDGPSYVAIDTLPPGATSYTATDLSPDEWYRFKVVANGQWTDSSATGSNAVQTTQLQTPTDLIAAAVSTSEIEVTFVPQSMDENYFEVDQSTDGTSWTDAAQITAASDGNATLFDDTGLQPGTQYDFRVKAVNDVSTSQPTAVVSALTQLATPANVVAFVPLDNGDADYNSNPDDNNDNNSGLRSNSAAPAGMKRELPVNAAKPQGWIRAWFRGWRRRAGVGGDWRGA